MHHNASASVLRGRLVNATLAMAVALTFVLYLQHVRGVVPCHLCYAERTPYYVGVPLGLGLAAAAGRGPAWAGGVGTLLLAAVMGWGAWLGTFHVGVERGWWPGPTSCSSAAGTLADPRQLLAQLHDLSVVACDKVTFTVLGQSLATWNALLAAGLAAYLAAAAVRFVRERRVERHVGAAALPA